VVASTATDRWIFCSDEPTVRSGCAKKIGSLNDQEEAVIMTRLTPAIFFGHGNPMNAMGQNAYTDGWSHLGRTMPRPKAILSVSAHRTCRTPASQ
jgi:hypothetical protein